MKSARTTTKASNTTTTADLIPLATGGTIIDTPGIRQFELWDVIPAEISGLFRDLRPYSNNCRFPDCTHIHEVGCAVLDAVADGRIDPRRYDSYVHLIEDPSSRPKSILERCGAAPAFEPANSLAVLANLLSTG